MSSQISHIELLLKALTHKFSTTLNFVSNTSRFTEIFKVPINLNPEYNYEIGLLWFSVYNSVYNIPKGEMFTIVQDEYITTQGFPPGAYNPNDIFHTMKCLAGKMMTNVNLSLYEPAAKTRLELGYGTSIVFTAILQKILGFESYGYTNNAIKDGKKLWIESEIPNDYQPIKRKEKPVVIMSEKSINISSITSVNLMCSITHSGYERGNQGSFLYTFPFGKIPFGYRLIQEVNTPYYMQLNTKRISSIEFWIVDQDGNEINFNEELINFSLHLRQV